jgi:(4-(4-[2-(gamma-L-glutamylamino)ethyl]phenoxymethyl)furan-2-yl)methanamine synthase
MNGPILGWDVGGANIKAAWIQDGPHADTRILEVPFALWREPDRLPAILTEVADRLGGGASTMAVTMTAELADCFATKREGVAFVLDAFNGAFPHLETLVFGTDGRFRSVEAARTRPELVAAANWMASAMVVARSFPDTLFLDVGSTTSDIIPIVSGRVAARGRTDTARLRTGELVYTGALRTPVAAIVHWVPLRGRRCRVAAEHFAVAADIHLWRGAIQERDYTCETPDGRGRSLREAAARIARLVCADLEALTDDDVTAVAEHVARAQVRQIATGIRQVVRPMGPTPPRLAVLAGQGIFLARAAAEETGLSVHDLASDIGLAAARAAPAAAVARLLMEIAEGELLHQ